MKFVAETPDLTLELTTLSGEEIVLEPTTPISGKRAKEIVAKWTELEKEKGASPLDVLATELSHIYPKPAEWFLDNFDTETLGNILTYVAQEIGGIKKKQTN